MGPATTAAGAPPADAVAPSRSHPWSADRRTSGQLWPQTRPDADHPHRPSPEAARTANSPREMANSPA